MGTQAEYDSQRLAGGEVTDKLGSNDADNIFSSASTAANADGSVLERLEAIKDQVTTVDSNVDSIVGTAPATFSPKYGYRVTATGDISGTVDQLFDVTGLCEISMMVGEVSSVLATSSSLSLNTSSNDQVIAASTQVTSDALGTLYWVSGDPDLALNGADTPGVDAAFMKVGTHAPFLVNDDAIEQNVNGAGTGTILWSAWYWPLEASASVAAA